MSLLELEKRAQENRKQLLANICKQHEIILNDISGVKFCFKKVTDKRDGLSGYLNKIPFMNTVPYLFVLGPNVTQQNEEAIRLEQIVDTDSSLPWNMDCLIIKSSLTTFGKIYIRGNLDYEETHGWLVQKRDENFWNITKTTDLERIVRENKEVRCLGVYLYKDKESDPLKADIFPVRVNAKEIIALCPQKNKGWMEMETAEQPKQTEIKSDRMLREYLKSPGDFFNTLWTRARAKTDHKESTIPISRPVAFDNHISGTITSYGYSERTNVWDDLYGTVSKNIFHKTHVMLRLTDVSQSSFEEGIVQGATSLDDLCNVEICWLASGDIFYTLTRKKPGDGEQRNKKEKLDKETQQWLASIIDEIHFSDV